MKKLMYTIYDSKANVYAKPIFADNQGSFLRDLVDLVNNSDTVFAKHPEDFSVFLLGVFDLSNATFDIYRAQKSICNLIDLVNNKGE